MSRSLAPERWCESGRVSRQNVLAMSAPRLVERKLIRVFVTRVNGHCSTASYTFPFGWAVTPPNGSDSGKSRRATPIRLSAIP